eukprot:3936618-Rhodomonas_salina.1
MSPQIVLLLLISNVLPVHKVWTGATVRMPMTVLLRAQWMNTFQLPAVYHLIQYVRVALLGTGAMAHMPRHAHKRQIAALERKFLSFVHPPWMQCVVLVLLDIGVMRMVQHTIVLVNVNMLPSTFLIPVNLRVILFAHIAHRACGAMVYQLSIACLDALMGR